jgi:phosphohistidine phosphatase SixA
VVGLVGHNPTWSEVASVWLGRPIELRTAEVLAVSLPTDLPWSQWREAPLTPLFLLEKPS